MIHQAVTLELALIDTICMFIHMLLVLMEYVELSVIQSLLESTPSHSCDLMETSNNCHSGRCFCSTWVHIHIFEFMYCDFIKTKGSSYSSLFNNYIQGGQVLCTCNHAIVFRVLLHTDCVIYMYIFFFEKIS